MRFSNLSWVIVAWLFIGCDVPGRLKINNKTSLNINIRLCIQKEYTRHFDPKEIYIESSGHGYLNYGFGTRWSDDFIEKFGEQIIDTVYVENGSKKYYCSNISCKKEIFNRINRKSKRNLQITIDSSLIKKSFKEIE